MTRRLAAVSDQLADVRTSPTATTFRDGNGNDCSALNFLRWRLQLPLTGIKKYGNQADAEYDLQLDDGRTVPIGTSRTLLDQSRAREVILACTDSFIPRIKVAEWDDVVIAITDLVEVVDTGTSEDVETRAWLAEFYRGLATPVDEDDRDKWADTLDDANLCRAIIGKERIYLLLPALAQRINTTHRLRLTTAQLAARLARLGFVKRRETARRADGTQSRRMLWHSPAGYTLDDDGEDA